MARNALDKAEATIGNEGEAKAEKQVREAMSDLTKLVFNRLKRTWARRAS